MPPGMTSAVSDIYTLSNIGVGGRQFWLFVFAGGPPFILYTYLIFHVYTLCIYIIIYMFGGPPAMSKSRPPTTMIAVASDL